MKICGRCGLATGNIIDLDTGGTYHSEPSHCIQLLQEIIHNQRHENAALQEEINAMVIEAKKIISGASATCSSGEDIDWRFEQGAWNAAEKIIEARNSFKSTC